MGRGQGVGRARRRSGEDDSAGRSGPRRNVPDGQVAVRSGGRVIPGGRARATESPAASSAASAVDSASRRALSASAFAVADALASGPWNSAFVAAARARAALGPGSGPSAPGPGPPWRSPLGTGRRRGPRRPARRSTQSRTAIEPGATSGADLREVGRVAWHSPDPKARPRRGQAAQPSAAQEV